MSQSITADNGKKKKILIIILGVLLLIGIIIGIIIYANAITAITMRIQRLVGTVNLYNDDKEVELREKMKLGAGQTVTTAGESLIMVSLDDTKLMTMEESSRADIKARGKKLEFDLIDGNLFFNVTKKLGKKESFEVCTSTMVCGIRGTSAYVGKDSTRHETLMVTDGIVHVLATNPRTLETTEVDVYAGEMITIYLDEEAEGDKTISIVKRKFREEDLPSLALDAIRKSPELQKRIADATGFSVERLTALADATSRDGISMYGSAADKLSADGIKDAIPIMGTKAHIMVSTANNAADTAGENLPLEIAIIKGLNGTMNAGADAGYGDEQLSAMVESSSGCVDKCISDARNAGLSDEELVTVANSIIGALQSSVGEMAKADLTTSEIGQVVDAIETVYTDAIKDTVAAASGANTGANAGAGTETGSGDGTSAGSGEDQVALASSLSSAGILEAVRNASDYITSTVDSEMIKKSTGEQTAEELLRKRPQTASGNDGNGNGAGNDGATTGNGTGNGTGDANGGNGNGAGGNQNAGTAAGAANAGTGAAATGTGAGATGAGDQNNSSGDGGSSSSSSSSNSGNNSSSNTPADTTQRAVSIAGNISGGTVTASRTTAAQGQTVTLTATPDQGNVLRQITVNKLDASGNVTGTVSLTEVSAGSSYSFSMPANEVAVDATFAPSISGTLLITGNTIVDSVLTATVTGGSNTGTLSYVWKRGGTVIAGATSSTYTLVAADKNNIISCEVVSSVEAGKLTAQTASAVQPHTFEVTTLYTSSRGNVVTKLGDTAATRFEAGATVRVYVTCTEGWEEQRPTTDQTGTTVWYDANGGYYYFTMPDPSPNTLVSLGVTFTAKSYAVTLNAAGGTINAGNVTTYTYGTGATLPTNVTKADDATFSYTFAGWFDAATGGNQVTSISTTDTGAKTLYAHWTATPLTTTHTLDLRIGIWNGDMNLMPIVYMGIPFVTMTDANGNTILSGGDVPVGAVVTITYDLSVVNTATAQTTISYDSCWVNYGSAHTSLNSSDITTGTNSVSFAMPDGDAEVDLIFLEAASTTVTYPISTVFQRGNIIAVPDPSQGFGSSLINEESSVDGITVSVKINGTTPTGVQVAAEENDAVEITISSDELNINLLQCWKPGSAGGKTSMGAPPQQLTSATVTNISAKSKKISFTMPAYGVVIYTAYSGTGYAITCEPALGGTVTATPSAPSQYISNVAAGNLVTITGNPDQNFALASVEVFDSSNSSVTVSNVVSNTATFTMPSSPVVVVPTFTVPGPNAEITLDTDEVDDMMSLLALPGVSKLTITYTAGDIDISSGSDLHIPAGKTLEIASGVTLYDNGGVFTNDGTMIIDAGGAFENHRLIRNDGTIVNNGTYTIGDSWGGVLYNYGTFTNNADVTYMQTSNHVDCFMVNYGTVDGSAASDVYPRQPNTVLEGYDDSGSSWQLTCGGILTISSDNAWSGNSWQWNPRNINGGNREKYGPFTRGVVINDGVTYIGQGAFQGDTRLEYIVIPTSVTSIEEYAFAGASKLTDIYYAGTQEQWATVIANTDFSNAGNGALSRDTVTVHYNSTGP